MEGFSGFIGAIGAAATSSLALVAYLAAIATWAFVVIRVRPLRDAEFKIAALPLDDQLKAVALLLNRPVPPNMTPPQFIRWQRNAYFFYGFLAICAVVIIVTGMRVWRFVDQRDRSDNLVREILNAHANSPYMSAINTLSNGSQMVTEAAAEIGPPMTLDDINRKTDELIRRGMRSGEAIARELGKISGSGKFQQANRALLGAAERVDEIYKKLADCYRARECRPGTEFDRMCKVLGGIVTNMQRANTAARSVTGVNFNASGGPPLLGGGTMDLDFRAIAAPNVQYLASEICRPGK